MVGANDSGLTTLVDLPVELVVGQTASLMPLPPGHLGWKPNQ